MRLRDLEIRRALHAWLKARHESDTLIRHELGICAGSHRVDIAVINGRMAGYEIKSDEDTLVRLAAQAAAYDKVLDEAYLVTTARHLARALEDLPPWWGVMAISTANGDLALEEVRPVGRNGSLERFAVAQLLWRDEALAELKLRGLASGLSKLPRHYVWERLADALELSELQQVVRERLKARPEWPGGR